MEKWKSVPGYEGLYEVSNLGNIKSLERTIIYINGQRRKQEEAILKLNKSNGYRTVSLVKNKSKTTFMVHRLVGLCHILNKDNKPFINHLDGNRSNNHYTNLQWSTNAENQLHSYNVLGNKAVNGRQNGSSKLTEYQVMLIKALAKNKHTSQKNIGILFGVTQSCIGAIVNNKRWQHLNH